MGGGAASTTVPPPTRAAGGTHRCPESPDAARDSTAEIIKTKNHGGHPQTSPPSDDHRLIQGTLGRSHDSHTRMRCCCCGCSCRPGERCSRPFWRAAEEKITVLFLQRSSFIQNHLFSSRGMVGGRGGVGAPPPAASARLSPASLEIAPSSKLGFAAFRNGGGGGTKETQWDTFKAPQKTSRTVDRQTSPWQPPGGGGGVSCLMGRCRSFPGVWVALRAALARLSASQG